MTKHSFQSLSNELFALLVVGVLGCDDFTCEDYATCPIEDAGSDSPSSRHDDASTNTHLATGTTTVPHFTTGAATTASLDVTAEAKDASVSARIDASATLIPPSGDSHTGFADAAPSSADADNDTPDSQGLRNGSPCEAPSECASTFCVDGICCDSACDDVCSACNVGEEPGLCQASLYDNACGQPTCSPDTECRTYAQSSPGQNCAGVGTCLNRADCLELLVEAGASCQDGEGSCSGEGECLVPNKKTLGSTCGDDGECGSGHCKTTIEGVDRCCDSACDGVCQACSEAGRCDQVPDDDSACGTIDCPGDTACVGYPDDLMHDRCAGFGQCVAPEAACPPTLVAEGASCGAGQICDGQGKCEAACQQGLTYCDGACIDSSTNNDFCGASEDCSEASMGEVCAADASCVKGKCKRWGASSLVGVGEGRWPLIVVDASSNVTILSGTFAYHRNASTPWTSGNPITTAERNSAALGITLAGTVWLAWESEGTVYARSYKTSLGWQSSASPLNVADSEVSITGVKLAVNETENVMVSWKTSNNEIRVNRFVESQGWLGAQTLNEPTDATATNDALAVDSFGNGVALWREADGSLLISEFDRKRGSWNLADDFTFGRPSWGLTSVGSKCRDANFVLNTVSGSDWSFWGLAVDVEGSRRVGPTLHRGGPNFVITNPAGACGTDKSRFVAWEEGSPANSATKAYAIRFQEDWAPEDPRWQAVHPLNIGEGSPDPIAITTDPLGNAFVAWAERDGSTLTVLTSRYDHVADAWSESIPLATGTLDSRSTNFGVSVATDPDGNGYVAWRLNGNVYLAEYR